MQNKSISYIIIANLLWSFIPIVVLDLFDEISVLMVVFLRFFVSGIILLIIAIILVLINNKLTSNPPISLKILFNFIFFKNKEFFRMKNIIYFAIVGFFGIIIHLVSYFLALKLTTISLVMVGFPISIIIIAFYEHGVKTEKLDIFKSLYIIILIFSISLIIFVKFQESILFGTEISFDGLIYIVIFGISLTFYQVAVNRDSYSKKEVLEINKNRFYKMPRLFIKISLTFLTGIGIMIPSMLIIQIFPIFPALTQEINLFFNQFVDINSILFRWEIIFLIIGATIIPHFLIFWASVKWNPFTLTFPQWNCILTIIEPIGGLFFGILLLNEFFPIEFFVIVLFLLIIAIMLRYVHEKTSKINAYLLLSRNKVSSKKIVIKLLKINGIYGVDSLIGTYDLRINVKTNSISSFHHLVNNKLRNLNGIKEIKILFINKIHKLNI